MERMQVALTAFELGGEGIALDGRRPRGRCGQPTDFVHGRRELVRHAAENVR